jgi:hypothetical protein
MKNTTWLFVVLTLSVATADFGVTVNGNTMSCAPADGRINNYGTHTTTKTVAQNWVARSDGGYDLKYNRLDSTHAEGGRCETAKSSSISGGATFEASIYIHSNVAPNTGVFTIGALPIPFNRSNELDLIVVNVDKGQMKSGAPGKAKSFPISGNDKKWIRVKMVRQGNSCSTTISAEANNAILHESSSECKLQSSNQVVINSRARDGSDSGDSFVSIKSVSWTSH